MAARLQLPVLMLLPALGLCVPQAPVSHCEATPEVRSALDQMDQIVRDVKYAERVPYQRAILQDLLRKYPADIELNRRYYNLIKSNVPDELPALRKKLQQAADTNDFLAVYLGGLSFLGQNTPEGLKLLDRAKSLNPASPWPDVALSDAYGSGGKFGDRTKALQSVEGFFHSCPDGFNATMLGRLEKLGTPELQEAV